MRGLAASYIGGKGDFLTTEYATLASDIFWYAEAVFKDVIGVERICIGGIVLALDHSGSAAIT